MNTSDQHDSEGGATKLGVLLISLLVIALLGIGAGGYHFANQLTALPDYELFYDNNAVVAATPTTVTFRDEGDAAIEGIWGLKLPGDRHAALGDIVSREGGDVTWVLAEPPGAPIEVGELVRIDEYVWAGTPAAVGLPFVEDTLRSDVGELPVWRVWADGDSLGTVIFVHGRGATREESLRFLSVIAAAHYDVLVISYPGDDTAPPPDGDRVRFGVTEWPAVEAAVSNILGRDALMQGEDDDHQIVLMGASMGASLIMQFMDRSDLAGEVDGLVLDSPVLSMDALLDLQANLNGVPEWAEPVLLPAVKLMGNIFFGMENQTLEQVEDDDTFRVPTLLFHGDDDDFVPVAPSVELAGLLEQVTYVPVPGAGHVRSWNVDRETYEAALRTFLDSP